MSVSAFLPVPADVHLRGQPLRLRPTAGRLFAKSLCEAYLSMNSRFVIVGAPAMGKSNLLRFIPSIIYRATCIDLEHTGFPTDQQRLKDFAEHLIGAGWTRPLFLGNAAANSIELALLGYQVIALHHNDHDRYLEHMEKRDQERGSSFQGDHWEYHRNIFHEEMPNQGIKPLIVDTLNKAYHEQPRKTIEYIASELELRLWQD